MDPDELHVLEPGQGITLMLGGNSAWIKAGSEQTGGAFTLLEYVAEPGFRMPFPHTHSREDEAAYVLEGQLAIQVGERIIEADAGAFIIKPRGIPHSFSNPTERRARFIEVAWPAGIEEYFKEAAAAFEPGRPPDMAKLMALMQRYGIQPALPAQASG